MATDGAYKPMRQLGLADWTAISTMAYVDLQNILTQCHVWESDVDPDGRALPRAKCHDDKTLVTVRIP